ncbi:D-alanyl-D-alanine carboxypeptidase family protein [Ornithinibacillus halotolerans]|uniref:D-alanyl-D-alanine carboxypeptidase DacB n=1 Tax=Ornithinibacillus halotolerans TaxID=1274357 RepID=A0A916W254_9BACI|nr:D-alanyl-D-alanine carboxypeptidase family protein [Ornithinibacillus halotolerans]GGA60958.1 D-alanyl-D-alanine carboxypeptidase DacB [Ornithinibacillus halotolerans]
MRYLSLLLIFILCFTFFIPMNGHAAPGVSAHNAVLIEQSTGRILYEKDAHEKQNIASITKIMTAIIAIESGKMDEIATASRKAVYTEGSSIYLEQGEKMPLEDLVYGLMLRSGNDAAVTIAEHVGGSEEGFVYLMNEKADWLGMTNTHFDNPHGLDSDTHYSSAYDMALLMRYAMDNDIFKTISSTKMYKSEKRTYSWKNKNKLLTAYYKYCTGGKTGFTKKTGRTLVSTASKDGMDLIAVTLNAPDDWRDHMQMYEWGFDNYKMESIGEEGIINIPFGQEGMKQGSIQENIVFPLNNSEQAAIRSEITPFTETLPGNQHIIGKQIYYLNDEPIYEVAIFQEEKIEQEDSFLSQLAFIVKQIFRMD